jgi:hypothetical protein
MSDKGTTRVAWDKSCSTREQEELGILNIATHNKALLVKNLYKFYNKVDLPAHGLNLSGDLLWRVDVRPVENPKRKV